MKNGKETISGVQQEIFRLQLILILIAVLLSASAILMNLRAESQKRDQNLQNVAEAVAQSPVLSAEDPEVLTESLDTLKRSLTNIDVISVVGADGRRIYHSNHALIGTAYDGELPDFSAGDHSVHSGSGPSGPQRRAYAAIRGNGGFVIAVTLTRSIRQETARSLVIYALMTLFVVVLEIGISHMLSRRIKRRLLGYEPEAFSAMYRIRDNILESLNEGIISVDESGEIQFLNRAAVRMLGDDRDAAAAYGGKLLRETLSSGKKEMGIPERGIRGTDVLIDRFPIREQEEIVGAAAILHDRTEYTRMAEDLAGTRYLVDSMRANNHNFTNKLHVILGLLQMEMYQEAAEYIEHITIVQREAISRVMNTVDEPSVAALLIGKGARASELNVTFTLREGSVYRRGDLSMPPESLVTIIGNLTDNALEALDAEEDGVREKELMFGIYSKPGALLITVDDNGPGIPAETLKHIFENGYSSKGDGRGTGLYQVKRLTEALGGTISVESQEGAGTSFTVSFSR